MNDNERQKEFLRYFEPSRERLSKFARAMCRSNEDAKDLISDTILSAYENFGRIQNKQAFLSYLFTTASRLYKRKLWRSRVFGIFDEKHAENLVSKEKSPDLNYDLEVLYKAINQLPKKQKEALVLYELSGMTLDEIKKIQGGTISGVKSRLKRAREKLEALVRDDKIVNDININYSKKNGTGINYNTNDVLFSMKVQNE